MGKHTQTIRREKPLYCLSVFDHFMGLRRIRGLNRKSTIVEEGIKLSHATVRFL